MSGSRKCGVYIHNEVLLGHKKDKYKPLAEKQMNSEIIMLSEIN